MGLILKHEDMLLHLIDRFYMVTEIILSIMNDINIPPIRFAMASGYLIMQLDSRVKLFQI